MAEIEPPSFSLGLDFDTEPGPENPPRNSPAHDPSPDPFGSIEDDGVRNRVSDSEPEDPGPTPLRRLRRGGGARIRKPPNPVVDSEGFPGSNVGCDDDEDIEEFSDELPAPQQHSLCSSSKLPLSQRGILTSQQDSKVLNRKRKQDASCHPSTSAEASKGKSVLSDLTASPLRRFRLLDSDSDSDSESDDPSARFVGCSKQNGRKETNQCEEKTKSSSSVPQKQDLWKDFYADKSCAVPTPAFDEFCEEYLKTSKQKRAAPASVVEECSSRQEINMNFTNKMTQQQDIGSTNPPSHRYFFHDDLRIQTLVHSRLPYFSPLGTTDDTESTPYNASTIDYMSQFGHGDGAKKQAARQVNARKSSGRTGKKAKNSNVENSQYGSGDWIDPKQTVSTPKDAGRRRVSADGQSTGHWFTAENGTRVYVTSTGKELRGKLAYMQYRKDTGKGLKRSKKKSASKKK